MIEFNKEKSAWITWEVQTRNRSMSALLNVPLYELVIKKPRYIKYPILIARTIGLVFGRRIRFLFVQNPSIVLSFLASLLKILLPIRLVVDAHNAGVYPLEGRSAFLNAITKFIVRRADITIVTNANLASAVADLGGRPFVMPDPLPLFSASKNTATRKGSLNVFFICTWADDEPYWEVIKAAEILGEKIQINITGNYKKVLSAEDIARLPANVKLLGFVDEHVFVQTFADADVSLDLTTRDHCLVCGAYESIALGVPGIVSESAVNREVFNQGFVYARNDSGGIAEAITYACDNLQQLLGDIADLKESHDQKIKEKALALINQVSVLK